MLMNSIANQGSIYHWARDHRVHHKYSETSADPHNATRGFFFAHIGWLYVKKHEDIVKGETNVYIRTRTIHSFILTQLASLVPPPQPAANSTSTT